MLIKNKLINLKNKNNKALRHGGFNGRTVTKVQLPQQ